MLRRDLKEVLEIERQAFDHPWSEDDFMRVLRQKNCIGMVADTADCVIGFMIYALDKTSIDILNFAVEPEHVRKGIGRAMVDKLKTKLYPGRRRRLSLLIRETNVGAQLFFRAMGFKAIKVVRDAFKEPAGEAAYLMQYRLSVEAGRQTA
jgi:ribosomal-protein-alanine N-acetyltransferase